LYEYQDDAEKVSVLSPFSSISSFESQVSKKHVNLIEKIDWKTKNYVHPVNEGDEKLLKMPSLKMREFKVLTLKEKEARLELKLLLK
jgi:hypothetical protein